MKDGAVSWENELWSYINAGDGTRCPLSDTCQLEKERVGCFNSEIERENTKRIHRFIDDEFILDGNVSIDLNFSHCVQHGRIFKLVTKLAQKFRRRNRHHSIPVPDNLISRAYDYLPIEVRYVPLKANHGAVWRLNECWLIHLNSNDTSARQRFTLYHETFHILAHCKGSPMFKKIRSTEVYFNEIVGDHFSANILLPQELVVSKWTDIKDISKLASIFDVPKPIMYLALRTQGLI